MRSGIQKAVWLHVVKEGGTWTPDEIAEEFGMGRQRANVMMQNMVARAGSLKRFKVNGKTAFGVTSDCHIPEGVTMREVRDATIPPQPVRVANSVFQLAQVQQ